MFLAFLILFAQAGQVVYAHTCFKLNETSYSLFTPAHCKEVVESEKKSCCAKKQATEKKDACTLGKSDCCGVFSKYVKGDLQASQTDAKTTDVPKDIAFEQPLILLPEVVAITIPLQLVTPAALPPGNTSSAFICVFRC